MSSRIYFFAAVLTLGLIVPAIAQNGGGFTVADLPACAQPCADNAAGIVQCKLTDLACLCASANFTQATTTCATSGGICDLSDQSTTLGVLGAICPDQPDPTDPNGSVAPSTPVPGATASATASGSTSSSASATGSSTSSSQSSSTSATSNAAATPSSTSKDSATTAKSTPTPAAANGGATTPSTTPAVGGLANGLTNPSGASSTVVVVQTVAPSDSSTLPSAAARVLGMSIGWAGTSVMVAAMAGALMVL